MAEVIRMPRLSDTMAEGKIVTWNKKVGDKIVVGVLRDGLHLNLPVTLLRSDRVRYKIDSDANVTPEQMVVRKKWLGLVE